MRKKNTTLKFVFVCSSLTGGGAERVAVNLANSLANNGHIVTVFLRRETSECYSLHEKVLKRISERKGVLGQIVSLKNLINETQADALISFTDIPNIIAYFSIKLAKKSSVFIPTIHTNLEARDSRLKHDIRFIAIRYLHKLACDGAARVVGVSKGSEISLVDYYGVDRRKALTIWNPVIEDQELVASFSAQNKAGTIKMVAAGRLTEAKNYHLMLDIVKKLNNENADKYIIDIYGQGELSEELKYYAKELGVEELVTFQGFVDDLRTRLVTYDVFVFTSDWEGFGNVLVEALCAGLSVVSTDCPSGPREILADGKFGRLVPVGDVDAFCAAVEEEVKKPLEISHDELCEHLDNFREGAVAQKYIDLVENVKSSQV